MDILLELASGPFWQAEDSKGLSSLLEKVLKTSNGVIMGKSAVALDEFLTQPGRSNMDKAFFESLLAESFAFQEGLRLLTRIAEKKQSNPLPSSSVLFILSSSAERIDQMSNALLQDYLGLLADTLNTDEISTKAEAVSLLLRLAKDPKASKVDALISAVAFHLYPLALHTAEFKDKEEAKKVLQKFRNHLISNYLSSLDGFLDLLKPWNGLLFPAAKESITLHNKSLFLAMESLISLSKDKSVQDLGIEVVLRFKRLLNIRRTYPDSEGFVFKSFTRMFTNKSINLYPEVKSLVFAEIKDEILRTSKPFSELPSIKSILEDSFASEPGVIVEAFFGEENQAEGSTRNLENQKLAERLGGLHSNMVGKVDSQTKPEAKAELFTRVILPRILRADPSTEEPLSHDLDFLKRFFLENNYTNPPNLVALDEVIHVLLQATGKYPDAISLAGFEVELVALLSIEVFRNLPRVVQTFGTQLSAKVPQFYEPAPESNTSGLAEVTTQEAKAAISQDPLDSDIQGPKRQNVIPQENTIEPPLKQIPQAEEVSISKAHPEEHGSTPAQANHTEGLHTQSQEETLVDHFIQKREICKFKAYRYLSIYNRSKTHKQEDQPGAVINQVAGNESDAVQVSAISPSREPTPAADPNTVDPQSEEQATDRGAEVLEAVQQAAAEQEDPEVQFF